MYIMTQGYYSLYKSLMGFDMDMDVDMDMDMDMEDDCMDMDMDMDDGKTKETS